METTPVQAHVRALICRVLRSEAPASLAVLDPEGFLQREDSWATVHKASLNHNCGALLSYHLARRGLAGQVHPRLAEALFREYGRSASFNVLAIEELRHLLRALHTSRIPVILLKGALHLVRPIYPDLGMRSMTDLDLLVPPDEATRARALLESMGYRMGSLPKPTPWRHHFPTLARPGGAAKVELHWSLLPTRVMAYVDEEALWGTSQEVHVDGLSARMLSPTFQVYHRFLHDLLCPGRLVNYQIAELYEFARLITIYGDSIDWAAIERWLDDHRLGSLFRLYCHLADKHLGLAPPVICASPLPPSVERIAERYDAIDEVPSWLRSACLRALHIRLRDGSFRQELRLAWTLLLEWPLAEKQAQRATWPSPLRLLSMGWQGVRMLLLHIVVVAYLAVRQPAVHRRIL